MTKTITTPPRSDATRADSSPIWDQLWQHAPSCKKDDALLDREKKSRRWSLIVDKIEAAFGTLAGLSSIELGSGRGDLSTLLARRGVNVTLLDASEKALNQARNRFDRLELEAEFTNGSFLEEMSEWQDQFDLVLSSGVIEHFKGRDRSRVIRAHREVLKPGGLSIISVPNAWCVPYRIWKFYLELRDWWPYGMEIPYSPRELERRAREVGFVQVETDCVGFWDSVRIHWMNGLLKRDVQWEDRRSRFDKSMGLAVLLFARCPVEHRSGRARVPAVQVARRRW